MLKHLIAEARAQLLANRLPLTVVVLFVVFNKIALFLGHIVDCLLWRATASKALSQWHCQAGHSVFEFKLHQFSQEY